MTPGVLLTSLMLTGVHIALRLMFAAGPNVRKASSPSRVLWGRRIRAVSMAPRFRSRRLFPQCKCRFS
jgi:hypothetical protein